MNNDYLRIYKSVHTWTGILSGMALFIAFYAGALSVFKEPLARWVAPPAAGLVPLERAQELVTKTLAADPGVAKEFSIHLHEHEAVPARMSWEVRDPEAHDHDASGNLHFTATLDAGDAAHIQEQHPSQLADFIDVLHRVVGLPVDSDPNRWFMGVVAVLYTLALVSGVVVLLPTLVADFFALRPGKNLKRMWLDAHNVVGIISLPFHIVMALTAVVFAFHDQIYALQDKLLHEGRTAAAFQPPGGPVVTAARDPATMLSPQELVARVHDTAPGFTATRLEYRQVTGARPMVRVWGQDETAVMPRAVGGFVAIDPYSGKILNTDFLPGEQSVPNLFVASFFALHMASFGGATVDWLFFLLGMAGAWLFYSGNLLWIESRRRAARRNAAEPVQRRDTRLMASATVGVCLGSVCGISLTIVAGKWLYGQVDDLNAWHQGLYYAAFFACVGWSLVRGAATAAVHLLRLATALTLMIPLTTLIGWLLPGLGIWAHGSMATLGVDATALAGAAAFAWMAHTTRYRVYRGSTDSVWSATGP